MHMDRVQFSNDQNLYQEKCRLEVQIFTQKADEFLRNTISNLGKHCELSMVLKC